MIIRRKHTANFTTIGNVLFNDERLQADEVGILAYLLSRPNDWEVRRPQLAKRFHYGRKAIKRVIWNGMRCGWIVARKTQLSDGRFFTVYEIKDEPGPSLSDEDIRAALSLGSSDADDADIEGDDDAGPEPPERALPEPALPEGYVVSSKEKTLLNTDSTKEIPTKASRAFSDVKARWPVEHVLSYVTCESLFAALNDATKEACHQGVEPYLSDCKAKSRKVCDLSTFIREARWERFQQDKRGVPAPTHATFKVHSPQWYRWREYRVATGKPVEFMDSKARSNPDGLWSEPSEWPPAIPEKIKEGA